MTPNPVRRDPGSTPRIRTLSTGRATTRAVAVTVATAPAAAPRAANAAGSNARQDFVGYLDIGVNVTYVVQIFQGFEQLHCQLGHDTRQRSRDGGPLGDRRGQGHKTPLGEY